MAIGCQFAIKFTAWRGYASGGLRITSRTIPGVGIESSQLTHVKSRVIGVQDESWSSGDVIEYKNFTSTPDSYQTSIIRTHYVRAQNSGEELSLCLKEALRQFFPQQTAQGKTYSPVDQAKFKAGIPAPYNLGGSVPGTVYPGAITLGLFDIHYDTKSLNLSGGTSEQLKGILEELSHTVQFLQLWAGLRRVPIMDKYGVDSTDYQSAMGHWGQQAAYYWAKAGGSYDKSELEIWAKNNANKILERLVNDPKYKKARQLCGFDLGTYEIVIR